MITMYIMFYKQQIIPSYLDTTGMVVWNYTHHAIVYVYWGLSNTNLTQNGGELTFSFH